MTESKMQAMADQERADQGTTPTPEVEFTARAVPYSSVVGSSIMLQDPTGKVIGQLALLSFGGLRTEAEYWAMRLTRALNNGAKAERAIANLLARGLLKVDRSAAGGKDGIAIRRE